MYLGYKSGIVNILCSGRHSPLTKNTPSFHTYIIRTADEERYFKLQIVSWYNIYTAIDDTGGEISYFCDELY